jgi:NADPH-dependent glutamate synthase beta subunit-like oxidoreductase
MKGCETITWGHASEEAERCLQCFDAPCTKACPAGIVIPRFIRMIRSGNVRGAAEVIRCSNPLALSCGLACPEEQFCASACTRGSIDRPIEIRRLHLFAIEEEEAIGPRQPRMAATDQARVAVIGSGPAGLACASELRRLGAKVLLYERRNLLGGILSHSIPLYRFPNKTVLRDASWALGIPVKEVAAARPGQQKDHPALESRVELRLGAAVRDVEALAREFDAVFLAPGLDPPPPAIPGSELKGVERAEEFLQNCREARYQNPVGDAVIVIGGGNTAIDAAMGVARCGEQRAGSGRKKPRIQLLYRRSRAEMPAWEREVREAEQRGIVIQPLTLVLSFVGKKGMLTGVRTQRAVLGRKDARGRPRPVPLEGTESLVSCDQAIVATGMRLDRALVGKLPLDARGLLVRQAGTGKVRGNIFAGGDAAGGEGTIVTAVRDGKAAARAIAKMLHITKG